MPEFQGSVHSVRVDHERGGVVLRLVIKLDSGEKVPVEMRGYEVRGVLETGDQVVISGRRLRDRDGVIRPREVENLTSSSRVTVRRAGAFRRFFSFVFSLVISVVSGIAVSLLASLLLTGSRNVSITPRRGPGSSGGVPMLAPEPMLILPIILGVGVGLVIFI